MDQRATVLIIQNLQNSSNYWAQQISIMLLCQSVLICTFMFYLTQLAESDNLELCLNCSNS